MRISVALILLLAPFDYASAADPGPEKIDELFKAYASPHSPGCSVGVIRPGSLKISR